MKKPLSKIQEEIVNTDGNIIVRASAGAGKTHTMVTKIAHDIDKNRNHKVIAAITFTVKAANEIKERMLITTDDHFVGTNNSFAIEEIIKPFMKDIYGSKFDKDMSTDYSIKVDTFENAVEEIEKNGTLCSYKDNKQNFIFQLAFEIITKSYACQEYLKAKYFKIFVDEYQDCDRDMHKFFMYISDSLKIDTFVVGDEKQSIYIWRGAYPEAFRSIWNKDNYSKKFMGDNFRSCVAIQNYSNLLCMETRHLFQDTNDISPVKLLVTTNTKWPMMVRKYLDEKKTTALLRYSRQNAEMAANLMSEEGVECMYIPQPPIVDITTNTAWMYNAIANYFIIKNYSVYDFMQIIPEEAVGNKRIKNYLVKELEIIKDLLDKDDEEKLRKVIHKLADYFGYEARDEHIDKLLDTIKDKKYHHYYMQDTYQNISLTFHSAKGLEFDQVVIFAEDYRLNDTQSVYNHYVAATRARSNLIIVYLNNGYGDKQFYSNLSEIVTSSGKKMEEILLIYNN